MYQFIKPFGHHISGNSIGDAWMSLVKGIMECGDKTFDENRERLSLQNVRVLVDKPILKDEIINELADKKKIEDIIYLTFKGEEMYDCDVKPSFSPGAKSYYARLKEGKMEDFVVERLAEIPESKKAVISFIHWDDYKAVLANPRDDYLPCIVSVQFRLLEEKDRYAMTVNFNSRSIDAFQKSNGNMLALLILANKVASRLSVRLSKRVEVEVLDGFITDAHIYQECYKEVNEVIEKYNHLRLNDING